MDWGLAKVEVMALREEIVSDLKQGLPVSRVYKKLADSGRIQVSQRQFYRLVAKLRSESYPRGNPPQRIPLTTPASSEAQASSVSGGIPPRMGWDPDSRTVDELLNGKKDES